MSLESPTAFERRLERLAWIPLLLGALGFASGLASLLGWALALPTLIDWADTGITIKANAAVAAACAGAAIVLSTLQLRRATGALGIFVGLIGGATLLQHLTGWNLGIDTLFFDEPPGAPATASPGRMGPPASASFLLLGTALWLSAAPDGSPRRAWAARLGLAASYIGLLALIGHFFEASVLYRVARLTGIAMQTAGILILLGVGVTTMIVEQPPMLVLSEDSAAGALARRALPFIVLLPVAVGWSAVEGAEAGLFDARMGSALVVVSLVVLLCAVLWWGVSLVRTREQALLLEITKRERAQEALRTSERRIYDLLVDLQAADRRKDSFLATLAHELRNPLAPIRTSLELTKRAEGDLALTRRARETMERQLAHMVRLIDDLMDVSRITNDRLELKRECVELGPITQQAIEASAHLIEAARQKLSVALPPSPIYVYADAARIAQVLGNLLTNASKYTPAHGCISLEIASEGGEAVIRVRDAGIGIPAGMLTRVFDMFVQIAPPASQSQGGLGIGLALVKRLVEMHGGSVSASSEGDDKGSMFTVRLPVASAELANNRPMRHHVANPPETSAQRILVVDDNLDAAESLAMLLREIGHEVTMAHDGCEALARAQEILPDVILLDIGLPSMDGYACCRAIRSQPWGREMLIVATTGWGQEEDRRRASEAGFDNHLVKPLDPTALIEMFQRAPRRRDMAGEPAA